MSDGKARGQALAANRPPPGDAAGARGHAALAVRRDLRGAVPHPGLRLRRARNSARRASRARTPASSIRASPTRRSRCSSSAWPCSRAPRPPRHGDRHGGGHGGLARAAQGRRSRRRGARAVRLVPLRLEELLPRFGVASTLVDGRICAVARAPCGPHQDGVPGDPSNPTLELVDIAAVADIAHAAGARSWSTTCSRRRSAEAAELGADVVVYSATKHIDGQGRVLGGVILGRGVHRRPHSYVPAPDRSGAFAVQRLGAAEGAGDAWRPRRGQTQNAGAIADALATHPKSRKLIYPGRADHPQAALVADADAAGSTHGRVRSGGRQGGGVPHDECTKLIGVRTTRRCEEPRDASGHHHAQRLHRRSAPSRHHRGHDPLLRRPRTQGRPDRGLAAGAGEGVRRSSPLPCGERSKTSGAAFG